MGFKQVFDNLTVKHMDVLNHCFWAYSMLRNLETDRKK